MSYDYGGVIVDNTKSW